MEDIENSSQTEPLVWTYDRMLHHVGDFWSLCLSNNIDGKNYLRKRGVTKEVIEKFKIGFAERTQSPISKIFSGEEGRDYEEACDAYDKLGMYGKDRKWDKYHRRIMIPVKNFEGKTIKYMARSIDPEKTPADRKFK